MEKDGKKMRKQGCAKHSFVGPNKQQVRFTKNNTMLSCFLITCSQCKTRKGLAINYVTFYPTPLFYIKLGETMETRDILA